VEKNGHYSFESFVLALRELADLSLYSYPEEVEDNDLNAVDLNFFAFLVHIMANLPDSFNNVTRADQSQEQFHPLITILHKQVVIFPRFCSKLNQMSLNDFVQCCKQLSLYPDMFTRSQLYAVFKVYCEQERTKI